MDNYPYTVYVLAGTQAESRNKNLIYLMKWTDLHKTQHDDDPEREDE
jgi:ribosome assembly protein RRB1